MVRNASEKLKLIQMVHDNPILWDSRLANFKGATEEKNRAWELIGQEFNAPGRRVARAFKTLREFYRRELAHVKLMGNGFKPKWSLYEAMDFLRDVIRDRNDGSYAAVQNSGIGLNLSAFSQHLPQPHNNHSISVLKLNSMHSPFNDTAALNLSKCSSSLNQSMDYENYVKSNLADLTAAHNNVGQHHPHMPQIPLAHHHQQHSGQNAQQQQQATQENGHGSQHDSRVSSSRNNSTQTTTFDDTSSIRNAALSYQGSDEVKELEAIDADFPYPLILYGNSPANAPAGGAHVSGAEAAMKDRRKEMEALRNGAGGGAGADEDQMLQQHRHLRQQNATTGGSMVAMPGMGGMLGAGGGVAGLMPPPQSVREVLKSKFCDFLSAKLNSMEDTEAENLMNKIFMLLAQKPTAEGK